MRLVTHKLALATLIAAAPAAAEPTVLSSHEVRFRTITFTCGEIDNLGKPRRFLFAKPYPINLAKFEPLPGDPDLSGWLVVYRTICEKAARGAKLAVAR